MSGARSCRNGSSTAQLPPLPRNSKISLKLWGMQSQSAGGAGKDWSARFFRFLSNRRTGLYAAAILICVSVMLVSDFSLLSLPRPPLQGEKQRSIFGKEENQKTISMQVSARIPSNPINRVEYVRSIPPTTFLDPPLPRGHPCETFTMPPPPADKKRTGPRPCPVCYLPVEDAQKLYPPPGVFPSLIVKNLTYVREDGPAGSNFGGHPSLEDREASYKIAESMHLHCGFARGIRPGIRSGFDIAETDLDDMEQCDGVVVISAIFGNYDPLQQPKGVSEFSKKNVCFFMFVDEATEKAIIKRDGGYLKTKKVGLWRVVRIHNIPYLDPRRTGKIPKLLSHRLFPNARFSLWIDGKLELVVDPYQILERFLWRSQDTFAISKHYKRFDVFTEAEANKAAAKYNNVSIDAQVDFYRKEGLKPYSSAKLPIVSDVPEGCVIIREHTPITNLFTCLWFNEVDRFTSRDQISFGIVRDKVTSQVPWRINMFWDCQRRNFVVQGYHRDVLEQKRAAAAAARRPPAPARALPLPQKNIKNIKDIKRVRSKDS